VCARRSRPFPSLRSARGEKERGILQRKKGSRDASVSIFIEVRRREKEERKKRGERCSLSELSHLFSCRRAGEKEEREGGRRKREGKLMKREKRAKDSRCSSTYSMSSLCLRVVPGGGEKEKKKGGRKENRKKRKEAPHAALTYIVRRHCGKRKEKGGRRERKKKRRAANSPLFCRRRPRGARKKKKKEGRGKVLRGKGGVARRVRLALSFFVPLRALKRKREGKKGRRNKKEKKKKRKPPKARNPHVLSACTGNCMP